MAMGTRKKRERQEGLCYRDELPEAPGHPFYKRLNQILDRAGFDGFCEGHCRTTKSWEDRHWRPACTSG